MQEERWSICFSAALRGPATAGCARADEVRQGPAKPTGLKVDTMNALFHSHSGLRYLVLLSAIGTLGFHLAMALAGRPYDRAARVLGSIMLGLLHLQVLVGVALALAVSSAGGWYPALWLHGSLMLLAAMTAQLLFSINKRLPRPGHGLPLAGSALALALMVAAIFAIGRTPFQMTRASAAASSR
jgi:hypothetical protein